MLALLARTIKLQRDVALPFLCCVHIISRPHPQRSVNGPKLDGNAFQPTVNTLRRLSKPTQFEDVIVQNGENGRIVGPKMFRMLRLPSRLRYRKELAQLREDQIVWSNSDQSDAAKDICKEA